MAPPTGGRKGTTGSSREILPGALRAELGRIRSPHPDVVAQLAQIDQAIRMLEAGSDDTTLRMLSAGIAKRQRGFMSRSQGGIRGDFPDMWPAVEPSSAA